MLKLNSTLVCMRHPKYDGKESPDLACKICCSKFVDRIRADQKETFEATWNTSATEVKSNKEFTPMPLTRNEAHVSKRQTSFDGIIV